MTYYFNSTPREDGFFMPGEFAPHEGCWMLWPERPDVWRENARPAQEAFAQVAAAISRFEPVFMGVHPEKISLARRMLPAEVQLFPFKYNDAWIRDNGPTFVISRDGRLRGIDWDFNAWGGLYQDFKEDDALASHLLSYLQVGRYKAPLVLEGGAIDVDGEGTVIVTAQNLLHPNRNPTLSRGQIEDHLKRYLNVDKVIWIPRGVFRDETDGHIDNLCCFVRPGVVALTWTDDEHDPQYESSHLAFQTLSEETDAQGRKLEIHKIHQPDPIITTAAEAAGLAITENSWPRPENTRLAGSYINYYVANGGVVVPQFNDPHDEPALEKIQLLFPEREVVGVYAREILLGGGNIHCITQQQPQSLDFSSSSSK